MAAEAARTARSHPSVLGAQCTAHSTALWVTADLDEIHEVDRYPEEDSACRALDIQRRRGGNAGNAAFVLAQLLLRGDGGCRVRWAGVVPRDADDATFVLDALAASGVDTSLREEVAEGGMPTAVIIKSRATGSRTIVSSRRGMRELSVEHFYSTVLPSAAATPRLWTHFEVRETASCLEMVRASAAARREGRREGWRLSCEVEKPAFGVDAVAPFLAFVDVAFLSKEWVLRHGPALIESDGAAQYQTTELSETHLAVHALRALVGAVPRTSSMSAPTSTGSPALWIVAWGALGAFALSHYRLPHYAPAISIDRVLDSTGAGDTFNAAVITALSRGASPTEALRVGCHVAGRKVAVEGFEGLSLPSPELPLPERTAVKRARD